MKKTCYIGGAAGLIGGQIAADMEDSGHKVYKIDSKEGPGIFKADLSSEKEVKSFFKDNFESADHCVLINCQAIAEPHVSPLWELESSSWDKYININLNSYFYMCKYFIQRFIESGAKSASIINLSSTRHLMAEPNTEPYCASKGAIASFSKALAISAGELGIRVNVISPGWIDAENAELRKIDHSQHPSGRVGTPKDISKACLYLADPDNSFMTGQDIIVDGGMTSKMIYQD